MVRVKGQVFLYDLDRKNLMPWLAEFQDEKGVSWKAPDGLVWSPDGKTVAFSATSAEEQRAIFTLSVDRREAPTRLTDGASWRFPTSWSSRGDEIVFVEQNMGVTGWDIREVPLNPLGPSRPLLEISGSQGQAVVSPDGDWIAYASSESGHYEVYLEPFHAKGEKVQVSSGGGSGPTWSRDGSEIYYRNRNQVFAVSVTRGTDLSATVPRLLFEGDYQYRASPWKPHYDLAPDGKHFIMIQQMEAKIPEIHIVLNWFDELERLVPTN